MPEDKDLCLPQQLTCISKYTNSYKLLLSTLKEISLSLSKKWKKKMLKTRYAKNAMEPE